IDVRVEEADRDRLDILFADPCEERLEARKVERSFDGSVPAEPLNDLDDVTTLNEPVRLPVSKRIELFPIVARDRVRVAEAVSHDEQETRSLALQKRVQPDGRAVDEKLDPGQLGNELAQPREHALRRAGRRREHLPRARRAVV